jgi:hypothetical protein
VTDRHTTHRRSGRPPRLEAFYFVEVVQMGVVLVLLFLVAIGPLAYWCGVDSRVDDPRGWIVPRRR